MRSKRKRKQQNKSTNDDYRVKLDLHGMTVEEALDKVEYTLDRALLNQKTLLEIVHGLGTGKLKNAIHKYLENSDCIESFKLDESNPGRTLVYL